jgi:hypothetical protein
MEFSREITTDRGILNPLQSEAKRSLFVLHRSIIPRLLLSPMWKSALNCSQYRLSQILPLVSEIIINASLPIVLPPD